MPDENEIGHELVMPFVTVTSNGGIHDDTAYAAGWEMGDLDRTLTLMVAALPHARFDVLIRTVNVPQADLIAMKHGFKMTLDEPNEEYPDWTYVHFDLADPTVEAGDLDA